MRMIIITVGFVLMTSAFSCSDKDEDPIRNSGAFTVDGVEFPIDKAMLLSSCAWTDDFGKYSTYLLFMPQSTITHNTCDNMTLDPPPSDWISMGVVISDPNGLDAVTYTADGSPYSAFFVRLHSSEEYNYPLVDAWLSGQMKVTKKGQAYSIELDFEFEHGEETKTLTGTFYGTLVQK